MSQKRQRKEADPCNIKTSQFMVHQRVFQSHRTYFKVRGMKAEVSGLGSSEESRTRIPHGALTGNHHAEPNYELVKCVHVCLGMPPYHLCFYKHNCTKKIVCFHYKASGFAFSIFFLKQFGQLSFIHFISSVFFLKCL